ncbi:MAG: thioredoxin family protein [Akkermansia sp.]
MIAPIIDQLRNLPARSVGKVEPDANNGLAATYGVRTIPTLLIIKDGEIMTPWWAPLPRTPFSSACARSCNRSRLLI